MQQYGATKNPPWARTATAQNIPSMQQQLMGQNTLGNMGQPGMVQYQQSQPVFQPNLMQQQTNMALGIPQIQQNNVGISQGLANQLNQGQMFQQPGVVTYPTPRALNPNAFANTAPINPGPQGQNNTSTKQRVFTGTVTKAHNDFGFVDEDVFFQTSACMKGSHPVVGDRVLVEASFNPNMPFKWNATRIQVIQTKPAPGGRRDLPKNKGGSGYNAVPPPIESQNGNYQNLPRSGRDRKPVTMRRDEGIRPRDGSSGAQSKENDRKRKRLDREKERIPEKVPEEKERTRSPLSRSSKQRRRPRPVARYLVQIPKIALDIPEADVLEIKRRYTNLYIPSDFFNTQFRWIDAFPPNAPFTMNKPCAFHVIHKDIDNPIKNDAILEPPDVDYLFSAKVMLLSMPTLDEVYRRCCGISNDEKERDRDSEERDFIHPTRLINFLVGLRGKNETMAIGGPWSPSLDGPNPESDPSVLIKTAIRTCKAHTGIDLSNCTQWYRFVELYYRRAESVHRGRQLPARVETVVIFVPDVWSCLPTRLEWDSLSLQYKRQAEGLSTAQPMTDADQVEKSNATDSEKKEPTHYSELDPKTMSLPCLRKELEARNVNNKGLKSQLIARLTKCLKQEASKDQPADNPTEPDVEEIEPEVDTENSIVTIDDQSTDDIPKKKDEEKEKNQEKEDALWKARHILPASPHLIVHPSRVAKSGKFDCTVMTLSLLLDYRPEDSKEHSFEVSLFAELFNEMLMRDFGFNIYKALYYLPEKSKDEKDDRKKDDPKKSFSDLKDKKSFEEDKDKKSDNKEKNDSDKKIESRKDDKGKSNDKRDDVPCFGDEDNSNDRKSTSGDRKDKDKKEKNKLVTRDPHLLLSFVYFDTSHCGYIFEKDIEELLYTLGLNLSRAQVRKLVSKVVTRETFHYRRLTDKPKDDVENLSESANDEKTLETDMKDADISELAAGNKKLLPVFVDKSDSESSEPPLKKSRTESCNNEGFVSYKGGLLDIEKLMNQLKRSEQARFDTEVKLMEIKEENSKILEKQAKYISTTTSLSAELEDTKKKLNETQNSLSRMAISSKIFHNALKEIETKVMSVIHTTLYDDPDSIKINKSEATSRWSSEHGNNKNSSGEGNFNKTDSKFVKEELNEVKIKTEDTSTES